MTTHRKKLLTTLHFNGARFEDHGLDLDVLPELIAYKKLIVETAKELWKAQNADRERLPRGFEENFVLKIFGLSAGSVAIDLERVFHNNESQTELELEDETDDDFDRAVPLLEETMEAMSDDRTLPDSLPASVIPLFSNFGATLQNDEYIGIGTPSRPQNVRYDRQLRDRLIQLQGRKYEDDVKLLGEVRKADIDGLAFSIRLDDGNKIEGKYSAEQEKMVLSAFQDHEQTRIKVTGRAEFDRQSGRILKIVRVDDLQPTAFTASYEEEEQPIWDVISTIGEEVPKEEWEKVPKDLATNLDHYLYGSDKESS